MKRTLLGATALAFALAGAGCGSPQGTQVEASGSASADPPAAAPEFSPTFDDVKTPSDGPEVGTIFAVKEPLEITAPGTYLWRSQPYPNRLPEIGTDAEGHPVPLGDLYADNVSIAPVGGKIEFTAKVRPADAGNGMQVSEATIEVTSISGDGPHFLAISGKTTKVVSDHDLEEGQP